MEEQQVEIRIEQTASSPTPDLLHGESQNNGDAASHKRGHAASHKRGHAVFTFLIGVLLILTQLKFSGPMSPFEEYPITMSAFIMNIFIYGIGYMELAQQLALRSTTYSTVKYVVLASGFVSCELILRVLVPVIPFVVINVCVAIPFMVPLSWCQKMFDIATVETHRMQDRITQLLQNHFDSAA